MAEDRKSLQQEREELELEQLREEVGRKRAAREMRKAAQAENEKAFKEEAQRRRENQGRCNHKKGGKDYASIQFRGDGENYALMAQGHPLGYMTYLCAHCHMFWEPGVTEKLMKDKITPNPTGISYEQASRLPTDNIPAGAVIFGTRASA